MPFNQLVYRGNFECSVGADYSGSFLRADYGGGYSETEVIFPRLLTARLSYSALTRGAKVRLPSGESLDRLTYVWSFYCRQMDNGREPFLMRSPLDGKMYLWEFAEESLEITLVDLKLGTTGLALKQVYVRGVATNADGSIDEGIVLP